MKQDFRAITAQKEILLADKAEELRCALRVRDPNQTAERSGSSYIKIDSARGEFRIPFWGVDRVFSFPELTAASLSTFQHSLLLYYLLTADGTPVSAKWVSFADLPDGRTYNTAFQGYTGNEAVRHFGEALDAFRHACEQCGGVPFEVGDASYVFQALPRVPLMVTYWLGDEDFSSSCKILFDSSVSHYLPIEACAILGSALTSRLMKVSKQ